MSVVARLGWSELSRAPAGAGVYAWYYEPEITDYDLEVALGGVREQLAKGNRPGAEAIISTLLADHVLSYFRQDPYTVTLAGQLKPRHTGVAKHEQLVSSGLVQRIADNPERLRFLRDILATSAPHFASPIYVGMSETLRSRLTKHRVLIEKFRAQDFRRGQTENSNESEEAGFARRVVSRKISPDRLFVMVREINGADSLHVDAENLFNRIYYPILGRN